MLNLVASTLAVNVRMPNVDGRLHRGKRKPVGKLSGLFALHLSSVPNMLARTL